MHYKTTYLKTVILRLDYAGLSVLQTDHETAFTTDMRTRYPEVTAMPAMQVAVFAAPGGVHFGQQSPGWMRIHKVQGAARSVTLAPNFLALEYGEKAYGHFDELREQTSFVLKRFHDHFGAIQFTRIGLRYVNEITLNEGSALDWDGLINQDLVTSVKAGMPKGLRMAKSIHHLVAIKEDVSVILNYGINNPDFPNPVSRRQFILDLDCYASGVIESGEADQRIKDVNALAEQVFESSIADGLRDKMEIENQ